MYASFSFASVHISCFLFFLHLIYVLGQAGRARNYIFYKPTTKYFRYKYFLLNDKSPLMLSAEQRFHFL